MSFGSTSRTGFRLACALAWVAAALELVGGTSEALPASTDGASWAVPVPAIPPRLERALLEDYSVRSWREADGLPSDRVTALARTADGYVWIGTSAGLARFDGLRFERFDHSNVPLLEDHRILRLAVDGEDRLWLSTEERAFLTFGDQGWRVPRNEGERWNAEYHLRGRPGDGILALSSVGWVRAARSPGGGGADGAPAWERHAEAPRDAVDVLDLGDLRYEVWREAFVVGSSNAVGTRRYRLPYAATAPLLMATLTLAAGGEVWFVVGEYQGDVPLRLYRYAEGRLGLMDDAVPVPGRLPYPLAADPREGVWHPAGRGRLARVSAGRRIHYRFPAEHPEGVLNDAVAGTDGCLWLGLEAGGLMQLRPRGVRDVRPSEGLPHPVVRAVLASGGTEVWAGTEDGVARVIREGTSGEWVARPDGLRGQSVRALARGARGELWAGTAHGLFTYRAGGWHPVELPDIRYTSDGQSRGSVKVRDLLARAEGELLVVTANQVVVVPGDGRPAWTLAALPTVEPTDLLLDRAGGYWLATDRAGVWRWPGNVVEAARDGGWASVPGFPDDRWRLAPEYGWRQTNGLPSEQTWELLQDAEEALWIAGPRGLIRVPPGARPGESEGAPYVFTPRQGLPELAFNCLAEDPQGGLWLGGDRGLYRVLLGELRAVARGDRDRLALEAFTAFDGLPSGETSGRVSHPGAEVDAEGRLWVATANGLACVPAKSTPGSGAGPRVVLEEVRANGRIVATTLPQLPFGGRADQGRALGGAGSAEPGPVRRLGDGLVLAPGAGRVLEFRFTALDALVPRELRFQYQLEGYDRARHDLGDRRFVHITGLPPGSYRLRLWASGPDGVWSTEPAQLRFTLRPHFWQTAWFTLATGLALLGAVAGGVTVRVRQVRRYEGLRRRAEQADLQKRLARDLHDGVGSGLARLALLADLPEDESRDPERVTRQFRELSGAVQDLARTVREISWSANPAPVSLESLLAQIAQLLTEYLGAAGVRCRTVLPLDFPDIALTPEQRTNLYFAIKEAATNVVRHARATEAKFEVALDDLRLVVVLRDDGIGLGPVVSSAGGSGSGPSGPAQGGHGMANLRVRIAALGGVLRLRNAPGGGVEFRVEIPLDRLGAVAGANPGQVPG